MKKALSLLVFCALSILAIGQYADTTGISDAPIFENPTLDLMVQWYNLLYGGLVIVLGMIFKAFGVKKQVPNYFLVVLATGVVLAGAFVAAGFSQVIPLVFSFLASVGFYEALKRLGILKMASQSLAINQTPAPERSPDQAE